ncbi:MAG: DMT family transporter [Alphaproteobacteria bacterium]
MQVQTDALKPQRSAFELERRRRLSGIGLMCAALLCFAFLDALAKWLGTHMHPIQVVWARYVSALILVLVLFNPWTHPGVFVSRKPGIQAVRSALLFASTALNFFALQHLQLDQTVSIMFATPFIVAILAGPILGQWIGPRRWAAVVVGFCGVLVVTQPWAGPLHWAMVFSMIGATAYAIYNILTAKLSGHDSAATTSIYSVAFGALAATGLVPLVWMAPESLVVGLGMVAIGFFGAFGHWLLIVAHGRAPAPILAPFIYTQIVWMMSFGWIFFDQVPALNTLFGATIVIGSGLYLIYREHVVKAAPASTASIEPR